MCSNAQYPAYAHEYGDGFSELPAGVSPIEGSTSFQEMPGSFPCDGIYELGGSDIQKPNYQCPYTSTPYAQAASKHLRSDYKANQNAMVQKPALIPVTNLLQLPRLEVPESQNRVPRLMSDHCSVTASPISPITPTLDGGAAFHQNSNPRSTWDSLSPCMIPEKAGVYAHYGSCGQLTQHSPATPSTTHSYGLSSNTTPLSAHPSPGHASFCAWPQLQNGQPPPMYSQTYPFLSYNQDTNVSTTAGLTHWQGDIHTGSYCNSPSRATQWQDPQASYSVESRHPNSSLHALSSYDPRTQLLRSHTHTANPHPNHTYDETLPAHSPADSDTRLSMNPQQRHPPSACQHCEKVFTGKYGPGNLKRHVRQSHGSALDRVRHMCQMCSKMYNRADALRKHSWKKHRHEDARPNKRRR